MGLFDGQPSAADLARRLGIPVLAVIDASAMAQTFGAIAHGLATYQPDLPFAGVLANGVSSDGHANFLRRGLPAGIGWFGRLPRTDNALPERHLGLLQADEIGDLTQRLDALADTLADTLAATSAIDLPPAVRFADAAPPEIPPLLAGRRIAIARDTAFGFLYPANLETLRSLGADMCFFSPLAGDGLPDCDAVWLPGGYPELHAETLAHQNRLWARLRAHVDAGKPLLAECGGMMCLFEQIIDQDGRAHALAGVLPGRAIMQKTLVALGTQFANLPEGRISGHTFHHSRSETPLAPALHAETQYTAAGEAVYRCQRLTASYLHLYFPSNPAAVARLFS